MGSSLSISPGTPSSPSSISSWWSPPQQTPDHRARALARPAFLYDPSWHLRLQSWKYIDIFTVQYIFTLFVHQVKFGLVKVVNLQYGEIVFSDLHQMHQLSNYKLRISVQVSCAVICQIKVPSSQLITFVSFVALFLSHPWYEELIQKIVIMSEQLMINDKWICRLGKTSNAENIPSRASFNNFQLLEYFVSFA